MKKEKPFWETKINPIIGFIYTHVKCIDKQKKLQKQKYDAKKINLNK